jgi:hypothetical protein
MRVNAMYYALRGVQIAAADYLFGRAGLRVLHTDQDRLRLQVLF